MSRTSYIIIIVMLELVYIIRNYYFWYWVVIPKSLVDGMVWEVQLKVFY